LTTAGNTYTVPTGFTANQTLDAQVQTEGGKHAYAAPFVPLAVSSIQIGENAVGAGAALHVFTDGGIGFGKVQPYNKATRNLYLPDENLLRMAALMNGFVNSAQNPSAGTPDPQVWDALYIYNHGGWRPANTTFNQLRAAKDPSAAYADKTFGFLGKAPP
jgi:hypothetical protein